MICINTEGTDCIIFRRVRKIAKSDYSLRHVCLSVCLSAWNNSAPTGRIFMEFDIWVFFEKSLKKIQVSLKSDKNNGKLTWRPMYIYDNSLDYFQNEKCARHKL
jgi:hypothetical protein